MQHLNSTFHKATKLVLVFVLLIAVGSGLKAQKNIHFGLKAVPGIYWVTSNDDKAKNDGARFGFGYGAMLEFGLTENYYLVTGLEIVSAGAKTTYESSTVSGTTTTTIKSSDNLNIQYLQLPLFLKMKTKEIGMIKYFGQFGLGTGIVLSTKSSFDYTTTTTTSVSTTTSSGSSSSTDKSELFPLRESLLIGLGLEYNISGSTSLVTGLTFDNGFTPILKSKDTNPSVKSKGITLTIGILF